MARVVWKFELDLVEEQTLRMPPVFRFLTVAVQDGKIMLWAEVDGRTELPRTSGKFFLLGTGFSAPQVPTTYLGTVFFPAGFVFHIYREGGPRIVPANLPWNT